MDNEDRIPPFSIYTNEYHRGISKELKMRIKEEIRKAGYFWLPSNPERKIPGTLSITDGGNIGLEVVGLFDESIDGLNIAFAGKYELN